MKRQLSLAALLLTLLGHAPLGPQPVTGEIKLFNGKDLTNFYTYLGAPGKGKEKYGKNNDPDKVFTVADGMIRVSGEVWGCFVTEKEYEHYHLIVEFKWGQKTWGNRAKAAMDSGVLLHCVGEDGAAGGVWLESIECQMIEGGTGDFILVPGKNQPKLTATVQKRGNQYYFDPAGEAREFKSGRINWSGRDLGWKDVKGFRGKDDVEKPVGEWNRLECICDGDSITVVLNGKLVNAGTNASHKRGKILFQSEGAEVFFRRIELQPVKNLKERCENMLTRQIAVLEGAEGTRATHRSIQSNPDKKPTDINRQACLKLASAEKEIIDEANLTLALMELESFVAFRFAFQMLRDDMKQVHRRLDDADVSPYTQGIEGDIIDSLKETIELLKDWEKFKKELKNEKQKDKDKKPSADR